MERKIFRISRLCASFIIQLHVYDHGLELPVPNCHEQKKYILSATEYKREEHKSAVHQDSKATDSGAPSS
jgi:hypothetical protein